ncbi:MAG: hypothetical protein WA134_09635, partial [Rhodoferax sp.]
GQLRQRIVARSAAGHDASEATLAVLAQQMQVIEPLAPDEMGLICASPDCASLHPGYKWTNFADRYL